jgi:hypothetical protein
MPAKTSASVRGISRINRFAIHLPYDIPDFGIARRTAWHIVMRASIGDTQLENRFRHGISINVPALSITIGCASYKWTTHKAGEHFYS